MNPIIIYVMVTAIIAAGYLFIKYTDWKDKHAISEWRIFYCYMDYIG